MIWDTVRLSEFASFIGLGYIIATSFSFKCRNTRNMPQRGCTGQKMSRDRVLTDIVWTVGPHCGPLVGRTYVNPPLIWRLNVVNMKGNKVNWCRDISGDDKTTEWCLFLHSIHMTSACWVCPVYLLYIHTQHTLLHIRARSYTLLYA